MSQKKVEIFPFFTEAFNTSEQTAIQNTTVINEDNPQYGTKGGNNTTDKVYLLSFREITNPAYGFVPTRKATNTRKAIRTAYADAKDDSSRHMYSQYNYWLRSPGNDGSTASYVCGDTAFYATYGGVYQYGYNVDRDYDAVGVRPVLYLNLSDTSVWSYAGTVSSTGEENELPAPNPSATSSPSAGGPSVTGNPSVPQNSTTVTSSASARDIQVEAKEEGQRKNEKLTLAKVTGLKLKVKKKAIEASWKKASGATGYEIQVSTSKKFKKKSTKTTKKTKFTINKLKPKTKYFVRVHAYRVANGKKTYGKWSKVTNIKTKK